MARKRLQEVTEKTRLQNVNKAVKAQKLKDDLLRMNRGLEKMMLSYNKQKDAESKNRAFVTSTVQHKSLEVQPVLCAEQGASSRPADQLMSRQFGKYKTSTPLALVSGASRTSESAGYKDFRNSLGKL